MLITPDHLLIRVIAQGRHQQGRMPASSARSATRAERFDDRTAEKVAAAARASRPPSRAMRSSASRPQFLLSAQACPMAPASLDCTPDQPLQPHA